MPTRAKGKSPSSVEVPLSPKTFSPQLRDPHNRTAWDHLDDLAKRDRPAAQEGQAGQAEELIALARTNIVARQIRLRHLPSPMFGEPAWDMLLSLYVATRSGPRQTVSNLSIASGAPASTALRWIDYLEQHKYIVRRPSPTDRRVVYIELADTARAAIEAYLVDLQAEGVTLVS